MPRVSTKPKPKPKPTTRKPVEKKVEAKEEPILAIERKENFDMSKVTSETPKWGLLTVDAHNLSFVGENLVDLEIPYDEQNPVNHHIICINGNQIILGVNEELKVPKSVYDLWNQSVKETNSAKRRMKHMTELKV